MSSTELPTEQGQEGMYGNPLQMAIRRITFPLVVKFLEKGANQGLDQVRMGMGGLGTQAAAMHA